MKRARFIFIIGCVALMGRFPPGFCYGQSALPEGEVSSNTSTEVKALIESMHSFDPVERRNAARELGRMGEQAVPAVPVLIRALGDRARLAVRSQEEEATSASVAEAAMLALTDIGGPAVEPLVGSLENDDPGVRMMAVAALGRIRDSRAVGPLIEVLENDEDSLVRAAAVDALRKQKDPRALEALLAAEQNGNWVVRSLAKSAVEEVRAPSGEEGAPAPEEPRSVQEPQRAGDEGDGGEAATAKASGAPSDEEMTDEDLIPWGGEMASSKEPEAEEPAEETSHTVQRDETLYRIGRRYGVSWQTLMEANDLRDPTDLYVGQVLKIPVPHEPSSPGKKAVARPSAGMESTYVVQQGDTLYRIGRRHGVPWQTLMKYNNLNAPTELTAGQKLKIPPWNAAKAPAARDGVTTYTVQHGDILSDIGLLYGLNWQEIAAVNGLTHPDQIYVGQVLKIPVKGEGASE